MRCREVTKDPTSKGSFLHSWIEHLDWFRDMLRTKEVEGWEPMRHLLGNVNEMSDQPVWLIHEKNACLMPLP